MTELYRRILGPDVSAAERDLLCEASFGKPFSEAVYEMRLNDLKEGVKSRKYFVLSVCTVDTSLVCYDNLYKSEVYFELITPYITDELQSMSMLYTVDSQMENLTNYMYKWTNPKFHVTLLGADSLKWALEQIRTRQYMF